MAQLERLSRLKRFFSRQVAEAIVAGGEELLEPHRREITAVFLDLRGFTAFTDRADPDEVLELLRSLPRRARAAPSTSSAARSSTSPATA